MAIHTRAPESPVGTRPGTRGSRLRATRSFLSFRNASAIYVFVAVFVIFALWIPETFLTTAVWRTVLDAQAIGIIVAIGLVIPLSAGVFNLAIGAEVGFGAVMVAALIAKAGLPIAMAVPLTIAAGATIGLATGLLITRLRIDSFIATLGTSSILLAGIAWVSGNRQILDLGGQFQSLGIRQLFGVTLPVWIMLGVAVLVWYVLEKTPAGRRIYATGGNPVAARLAGVNTSRVAVLSLVACGVLTSLGGVLISARLATGDPTVGPSYLLPAFSAAFLGSTQFRGGRFNVWGTVLAAFVLAIGIKGLQLAGVPVWIPDLFNGIVLLVAVGLARWERSPKWTGAVRRLVAVKREKPADTAV